MQVDRNEPNSVLWLQQSLLRAVRGRVSVRPSGMYDMPTTKAVQNYQEQNGLPSTGEPDAATIAKLEQDIAELDAQPFKMKRSTLRPAEGPPDTLISPPKS
jgi:peptidoglycan hydrolase-like protein with peptidoglycan-binding domain